VKNAIVCFFVVVFFKRPMSKHIVELGLKIFFKTYYNKQNTFYSPVAT